ncbi:MULTISPECIES: cytochrome c [Niveibacterium]|uniref:Cytochrome c n=1 Tax=Niveibacterium microcysteis TaxID=2811415 RepID=A0ABX7M7P4_9RHOO|nr:MULTISPECIES: cytochrome c [Niveibacterium]QSI76738.1 cytochrome c [Niveibacterium microcysteis]
MSSFRLSSSVLLVLMLAGVAGCDRVDPNSPVAQRRKVFKEMTKAREHLLAYVKEKQDYDADAAIRDAEALQRLSRQPWPLFPEMKQASEVGRAKDAVWQQPEAFHQLAKQVQDDADALLEASRKRSLDAIKPAASRLEQTCTRCHDQFRQS